MSKYYLENFISNKNMIGVKNNNIIIATWAFSKKAVEKASQVLADNNVLDAIEEGIKVCELDESINTVGYGGLPNADGIVQLDAGIMDGKTLSVGCVASLEGIRTPISVARKILEKSKHNFLCGKGALDFAIKNCFKIEETLSTEAKKEYEKWKKNKTPIHTHDTIGMICLKNGNMAIGCSTSGLAFKESGRIGDSCIPGSGFYCDNDIGGAVATGDGDEILKYGLCMLVIENLRNGKNINEACQIAIDRIKDKDNKKGETINIAIIALTKNGEHGCAYIGFGGFEYVLYDNGKIENIIHKKN
jgi:N4-(beta-N-acetylglucosaminyl)-L-asparaginase